MKIFIFEFLNNSKNKQHTILSFFMELSEKKKVKRWTVRF